MKIPEIRIRYILFTLMILILNSCSSPFLKHDEPLRLSVDDEIPDISVKEIGEDPNINRNDAGVIPLEEGQAHPMVSAQITPKQELKTDLESKKNDASKNKKSKNKKDLKKEIELNPLNQITDFKTKETEKNKSTLTSTNSEQRQREPPHESTNGFKLGSRRPDKDPFRVGERVTLTVKYFKAQAGELTLEVKPMVEVNGRKSYRWHSSLRTTGMFSHFYSIEDWAETLVDFETLIPSIYTLQVKESAQLKNGKGYFDSKTFKAVYAEKKYTEKKGHQEKHQEWKVAPYSQNVFSAAFYMRIFTYEIGKEFKFYVSDDEKNMMFKGKALRKERVETDAGTFDTIVIKPEFEVDGVFKPVGDIFFWLTDDDRKLIVRIESEIKIGTLVMDAIKIDRGIEL